ncbi:15619_t:CDS:2 [Gigaspora margarita]|uniref:15619_t:CDS:1 n=1 Tax=Gigaspora margarita TaxID=4874 RepID=A0ABM8W2D5_GIGMA|nr:15619_t:CDS:2 [Gigaspora margarita]
MAAKYFSDLADDFKKLYETKEDWAERNDNGYLVFQKPNISSLVFGMILEYLYCGIVDFQGQKNNEIILELLIAADELGIQKLIDSVQEFLSQNRSKFLQSNLIKMFELFATYKVFDNLKKDFLETFVKNCKSLLRQDPIKILHFIIHHEEFNKYWKEFITLEQTLHELIQVVRFHQMNREEFMSEVWPLRYLLPDNLTEDILSCYLIQGAIPHYNKFPVRWGNFKIDSAFINKEAALLFTKWIDKKDVGVKSSKKIQYNFDLLFRSSIDGRVIDGNKAIYCNNNYGPTFGLGHDLHALNNSNHWPSTRASYPNIGIQNSFVISGYEVFQVVKN